MAYNERYSKLNLQRISLKEQETNAVSAANFKNGRCAHVLVKTMTSNINYVYRL
jgi:hypothetical protein